MADWAWLIAGAIFAAGYMIADAVRKAGNSIARDIRHIEGQIGMPKMPGEDGLTINATLHAIYREIERLRT